ncbi:lytic transglycosylase domain-containing protein [Streptomyces sp. NPDC048106]|uniref:lytic transglycosylase domain-containing protein n=1 Tax=Streptomyces sp. NPDC048106 TaxID=3155750 RepID=UPI003456480A
MSVSFIRRIASPKKALTVAAVAAATAGMALSAAPAQAAPASASSAQATAHRMIPDAAQFDAFSKIVQHESGWNPNATNGAMNSRYGSPAKAWSFWQAHGWY